MYLYIGDLINDQFVIDTDFVYKTSSGRYNYFSSVDNKVIETDGTKYFCYCKIENDASEKIEIIGNNNPFDQDMNTYYSYDPRGYNPDATGDKFTNGITGMSLILPHDCFFVVRPKQTQQGSVLNKNFDIWYYDRKNEIAKKDKIFGYIGNDTSVVLLTLRSNTVGRDLISDVDVYYSKKPTAETQFTSLRGHNLADTIIRLKWKATKNQKMAGMNTEYQKGKVFHGCPYSSRWKDAHFLGFEITPHTFINASNDDKSIFYPPLDDSIVYAGGTGYGLVCSSFTSLISGNSYPQAGDGAFHDSNFQKVKSQNAMPGDVFGSTAAGHVLWVDSIVQGGHVTMEATAPTVSQCIKDSKNAADITNYKTNPEVVAVQKYGYILTPNADYGFDENFLDFSDESMQILGGTVRPYRGDKCVYGSYDKSGADGLGIKITIHTLNDASSDLSGITKAYIEKPSGTIVEVDINGQTVIDIAEIVDEDGTYKLYSNADNTVKEQFRYFDSDDVELSFEADGTAVFSDNRIKYCYCRCNQKPPQYAHIDDGGSHPVVVAAGVKYPYLNSQNITHVFAAIAEDTTPDDSWGRYSCLCHYNG